MKFKVGDIVLFYKDDSSEFSFDSRDLKLYKPYKGKLIEKRVLNV